MSFCGGRVSALRVTVLNNSHQIVDDILKKPTGRGFCGHQPTPPYRYLRYGSELALTGDAQSARSRTSGQPNEPNIAEGWKGDSLMMRFTTALERKLEHRPSLEMRLRSLAGRPFAWCLDSFVQRISRAVADRLARPIKCRTERFANSSSALLSCDCVDDSHDGRAY